MKFSKQIDANFIDIEFILGDRLDAHYYSNKYHEVEKKIKSTPFEVKKFIDIAQKVKCGPFGSSVLAENYDETGIIMVRPLNLKNVLLSSEDLVRYPEASLGSNFPIFKHEDLLFARVGMPSCSIIPEAFESVTISPNIIAAELVEDVDAYYVAAFLNTTFGLLQIERRFKAVSQPTVSTEEIKTLDIPLPDIKYQNYIGNKVRKAEKLQEEAKKMQNKLNHEITRALGSIPTELFNEKKWGKVSNESLTERLDSNYYQKFYLKIEEMIKQTGNYSILSNVCETISQGYNKSSFVSNGNISAIGIGDFGLISPIANEDKMIGCSENQKLQVFDIVWCNTAHLSKYIGKKVNMILENEKFSPTAEVTYIRPNIEKINPYFLYAFFNTEWGYYQIQRTIRGMVSRSHAEDVKNILVPIIKLSEEQEEIFRDGVEKVFKYNKETENLILEAKNDVKSLIEGTFNKSILTETE